MAQYALVDAEGGVIRYQDFQEPPPALAPQKGLRWVPVIETTVGSGPIVESVTDTVTDTTLDRVTTRRELTPAEMQPPVPDRVTNFQARAALLQAGLFGMVNAALLALPEDSPERQAWEYANELTRSGTLVNAMAAQLGLTSTQLDGLFRAAAEIEA